MSRDHRGSVPRILGKFRKFSVIVENSWDIWQQTGGRGQYACDGTETHGQFGGVEEAHYKLLVFLPFQTAETQEVRSPLHFFLKCDKLTMTIVEETTFPFMACLRGSGMAEVWFLFLSAAYSKTNAGALPQTPGFSALVSRERLAALPHLLYHTSI